MGRPMIIALVGVDGSGKTTAAKALARRLNRRGRPATYFENGGGRPMLNWLARRFGRADGVELLGRHGYVAIEASLRWVAMTRAVAWSRLTGRIAVMDRWTCCQYVVMHARGDPGTRLARFCYAALPHPDLLCFLAVEPAEAQRRVRARGRDDEELDYLTALDHAYRTLPDLAGAVVVDAGRPADDVADHLDALVIRPR